MARRSSASLAASLSRAASSGLAPVSGGFASVVSKGGTSSVKLFLRYAFAIIE
jgi:hypothetical protein